MDYSELEERITVWVQAQPAIRAAIVIGSRARMDHPADQWSDLDLILFTHTPELFRSDRSWLDALGEVWLAVEEDTNFGDPEWLTLFEGWGKADFVFEKISKELNPTSSLGEMAAASHYQDVIHRGYRPLGDPVGVVPQPVPVAPPPTPEQFQAAVAFFLHEAVRTAKFIRRADLWRAQQALQCSLKKRLLQMIVWQVQAGSDKPVDTWYDGRYLHEWADSETLQAFATTFAGPDPESQWQALESMLRLHRLLAEKTARHLGYTYPVQVDERLTTWIHLIRSSPLESND